MDPTYAGWYVDASWYLTGETRNYQGAEGIFGRTKVKNPVWGGSGGWGAWQIAGRYDVLDLSDKAEAMKCSPMAASECGEQQTWLFGLNWLLTDYTALKLQVSQSHITGGNNCSRAVPAKASTGTTAQTSPAWACAGRLTGKAD